ncbi:hypothetical protein [Brevibacillus laterosporus]|uniref:hypothetical protein n=1 Tax=Brevibacillus laterosporus TaxID=1465 RepID=UPI003D1E1EBF
MSNVDPTGNWCESKDGKWAHPGGCSSKSSKKSHDNDHSGDFIIENGKVIGAFKYDDGSGARELEGFEDPFTYITGVGGLLKGAIKAGAKKASQEATATFIKMDLQFFSKNIGQGWIKHEVYNEVRNRFGKEGIGVFLKAMQKGIVGPESMSGIKRLSGNGVKFGKKTYQYQIKVLDKRYGDWRVYGNYDKKSGHIIFDYFDKGKH